MPKFSQMRYIIRNFLRKFIIFTKKIISLYLYFVIVGCLLSWIPNINPNYPLFDFIFKASGFYVIPPIAGLLIAPMLIMMICVLVSMGLDKLYLKYLKPPEAQIIVLTKDDLEKHLDTFLKATSEIENNTDNTENVKDDDDGNDNK